MKLHLNCWDKFNKKKEKSEVEIKLKHVKLKNLKTKTLSTNGLISVFMVITPASVCIM